MIIIIRALSQWGKDDGDYDSPTSRDETPDEKKRKKEAIKGEKALIKKQKKREKERRGNATILWPHLFFKSSTIFFMIESLLCCHLHMLVGIFHYRTWLVYSNDRLPQNALGLREQASWMHTHLVSFDELSYIYSSSASVAWKSLLTHIDNYCWASP